MNPSGIAFINGAFAKGSVSKSLYDIAGVSAAGIVTAIGGDIPKQYLGKKVAIYRSLV